MFRMCISHDTQPMFLYVLSLLIFKLYGFDINNEGVNSSDTTYVCDG